LCIRNEDAIWIVGSDSIAILMRERLKAQKEWIEEEWKLRFDTRLGMTLGVGFEILVGRSLPLFGSRIRY
jgi:hypothetical protein